MFHLTNFTESSVSHEPLDTLMREALGLDAFVQREGAEDELAVSAACQRFAEGMFRHARGLPDDADIQPILTGADPDPEPVATWAMFGNRAHWLAKWARSAFPRVRLSHSYAAMLMATTISPREIGHVEAPWPSFVLEVPEGLLPLRLVDGFETHISRIHVNSHLLPTAYADSRWWGLEMAGRAIEIHRGGPLAEAVLPPPKKGSNSLVVAAGERTELADLSVGDYADFWGGYDQGAEDRVALLAGRLVVGACVLLTERANFVERAARVASPALAREMRRIGHEPETRVYTLGRPVKVDFRPAVAAYLSGFAKTLSVQSLVGGHHKHQPYGPNGQDRKWIFVEPYWRGPEDAPILLRPHDVGPTP